MDTQPQIIKKFEPITCPHCRKDFYIGTQAMMSTVVSINTVGDIKNAKQEIKNRLAEITFKDEKEKGFILEWLDKEDTIVDASDIEHIIRQISIEQLNKIQNEEKKENN